jgi:hypothetical protein
MCECCILAADQSQRIGIGRWIPHQNSRQKKRRKERMYKSAVKEQSGKEQFVNVREVEEFWKLKVKTGPR